MLHKIVDYIVLIFLFSYGSLLEAARLGTQGVKAVPASESGSLLSESESETLAAVPVQHLNL
jgi:hypothetical protein